MRYNRDYALFPVHPVTVIGYPHTDYIDLDCIHQLIGVILFESYFSSSSYLKFAIKIVYQDFVFQYNILKIIEH